MKHSSVFHLFSSVGGGPLQRVAEELKRRGVAARLHSLFSPESWRALFGRGRCGRIAARLLAFGAYPVQALARAVAASFAARPLEKPVLVASTNPFFLPHFLVATKALHRCGVIALMYDMYPDALEAAGIDSPWLRRIMTVANRWMVRHADGVVYLGPCMRASAEARYGTNPNTWIIPNGANPAEFADAEFANALDADTLEWMQGRCNFCYVGNMGLMHDVETLERAVPEVLATLGEDEKSTVGFVIAATGPGEARLRKAWQGLDCVRFIGPQKDLAWAELLTHTDVALATLTKAARATCAPSKIYSAITAGAVPLVVAPQGSDLAELISRCGVVVEPGDVEGLVATIRMLHDLYINDIDAFLDIQAEAEKVADENDIERVGNLWRDSADAIAEGLPTPWATAIYHCAKRAFDIAAVSAGIAVIWPVIAMTAVAVRLRLGAPVLFRQTRPGLDGKPFTLCKFRTMSNAPEGTDATHDGERLSPFGRMLRALSLDELPTLWNVLRGDMSLVGPRPLLMSYLARYSPEQAKRQWAVPGVTGLAQVCGRNALSWDEKFALDVRYVENASFLLDLKILWKTVATVIQREGIQHADSATMPEFMGNEAK